MGRTVAQNVRGCRAFLRLTQSDLAEAMTAQGCRWHPATVSEVEVGGRNVTVDELAALASIFGLPPCDLLRPILPGSGATA